MGLCETINKKKEAGKENVASKKFDTISLNQQIEANGTNEEAGRVKECLVKTSSLENMDCPIAYVSKSICKISIKNNERNKLGSGFLLKFDVDKEMFYCLMSNEHVIDKDIINNHNSITLSYDSQFKNINLKLDKKERYIKSFKDNGLDITVVEIIEKDNISREYFLFPELDMTNNNLINSKIYILQYPKGEI